MAIISKGILGAYYGKVGEVVGSSWRGINYVKSLPRKIKRTASEKALNQRAKFAMVAGFLKPLREFLKKSFNDKGLEFMTSSNYVTSQLLKNAIVGKLPSLTFDYSKVELSKGMISKLMNLTYENVDNKILVNWTDSEFSLVPEPDVNVHMIIYLEVKNQFLLVPNVKRSTKSTMITEDKLGNGRIAIWVFCSNPEMTKFSDSQFVLEKVIS
jgi:hypothetical protein